MSKRKGIDPGRTLAGLGLLLLGAAGCAGGEGSRRPEPLLPADAALVKEAGRELMRDAPGWRATFHRMALDDRRLEEFTRIMAGLLVRRCAQGRIHPDSFGVFLAEDQALQRYMRGLRAAGEAAAPPLLAIIRGGDSTARLLAAEAAGRLAEGTLGALRRALAGGEPSHVAAACARALGWQEGSGEALEALLAAAGQEDFRVAGAALAALGRFGGPRARSRLLAVLEGEGDSFLRRQAALGIARLGEEEQVPVLLAYLEEMDEKGDEPGRAAAVRALRLLTNQALGEQPLVWRRWWASHRRR